MPVTAVGFVNVPLAAVRLTVRLSPSVSAITKLLSEVPTVAPKIVKG